VFASDALASQVRMLKRGPLVPAGTGVPVAIDRAGLECLVPHRAPMLLVDGIDAVDRSTASVRGFRHLAAGDFGFSGHFPAQPIYPGVLTIEAMGQLALTLLHFVKSGHTTANDHRRPPAVRAIHIHHASFLAPFHPGDTMTLQARMVDLGMTMITASQAWKGDVLAAFSVAEMYADE
jgi:3-hydroxyacyl-[acyl-carrier-protein] dehydratase